MKQFKTDAAAREPFGRPYLSPDDYPLGMANALRAPADPAADLHTLKIAAPVEAIFTSSVFMKVSYTSADSVAAGHTMANIRNEHSINTPIIRPRFVVPYYEIGYAWFAGRVAHYKVHIWQ